MRVTKAIRKYLAGYAEAEAALVDEVNVSPAHIVAIPSYAEADGVMHTLDSIATAAKGSTLAIVVVNEPPSPKRSAAQANQQTMRTIGSVFAHQQSLDHLHLHRRDRDWVLVVDRTAERAIPDKQGVGLARKIGFDVALRLAVSTHNDIRWIHGTDADALLPHDYFDIANQTTGAALLHRFQHVVSGNTDVFAHTLAYEATLRYYVLGLRHGGSPHAFHTIGSTISVSPQAYAAVRGVPKRNGAEDFYLLQKLHRVGAIVHADTGPIALAARASERVPFGTGPAVARAMERSDPWSTPTYHPGAFEALRSQTDLDALETLRFVRTQTERLGPLTLANAVTQAEFTPVQSTDDLQTLCADLAALERS